jgi:hypothetical protein
MIYLIDTWYVEYPDGTLGPCQNLSTAKYLVASGVANRIVDITREVMGK